MYNRVFHSVVVVAPFARLREKLRLRYGDNLTMLDVTADDVIVKSMAVITQSLLT
jgi:hypothetical protein